MNSGYQSNQKIITIKNNMIEILMIPMLKKNIIKIIKFLNKIFINEIIPKVKS